MEYSESVTINRPVSAVWKFVGDPTSWASWVPDVQDVEVEGGKLGVGSVVSYTWRGKRQSTNVTQFDPERSWQIRTSERNYDFHEGITIQPVDGGTHVTLTMGFDPSVWWVRGLSVLLLPVKRWVLGRPLRKELLALKNAVE